MAQRVKHLTLDFSLGHDLTVHEFKPHMEPCANSIEPALDSQSLSISLSLSLSLSLCPTLARALSLSLSK